jgi:DNA-binding response OmpR family regulator
MGYADVENEIRAEMSVELNAQTVAYRELDTQPEAEDRFAVRRRIALLEKDPALRPVVIRTLLRLGCVVSAKHCIAQVIETLRTGPVDGAVVAFEGELSLLYELAVANRSAVPVVVLTDGLPEPHMVEQFRSIHFLQKPFDMRELLASLQLPQKAVVVRGE